MSPRCYTVCHKPAFVFAEASGHVDATEEGIREHGTPPEDLAFHTAVRLGGNAIIFAGGVQACGLIG